MSDAHEALFISLSLPLFEAPGAWQEAPQVSPVPAAGAPPIKESMITTTASPHKYSGILGYSNEWSATAFSFTSAALRKSPYQSIACQWGCMSHGTVRDGDKAVEIDRSNPAERYRWTCPRGHTSWSPTNSHLLCASCSRQSEQGDDVSPEWYELLDQKTGELVPYSQVELVK